MEFSHKLKSVASDLIGLLKSEHGLSKHHYKTEVKVFLLHLLQNLRNKLKIQSNYITLYLVV